MNIDEEVRVGVVFAERERPVPRWFVWQRRRYEVRAVTYAWQSREADTMRLHFTVTDGDNVYELSFNQKTLRWRLAAVRQSL